MAAIPTDPIPTDPDTTVPVTADPVPTAAVDPGGGSPLREIMADRNFRRFFLSQLWFSLAGGTTRFAFAWIVVQLSDWPAAEGLVIVCLGLPALLFSIPAGAWSDRVDRKRLYVAGASGAIAALAAVAVVSGAGIATPRWIALFALVAGMAVAVVAPVVSAVVPSLVPPERLMNAAALQNGGMMAAQFVGAIATGIIFEFAGEAAGFAFLALVATAGLVGMLGVTFPPVEPTGEAPTTVRADMIAGVRYGLGTEPLRSLLVVALVLGSSFSVMQTTMPRVVDEVYGRDGQAAGLVISVFGLGMLLSSAAVASRSEMRHGRNVAIFIGTGLGLGQLVLSLQSNYWAAVAVMLAWGLNAGIAMVSHRTLLQTLTEPRMMGRVMGIMMLGFAGGLPIGAGIAAALTPTVGLQPTMTWTGAVTLAVTLPMMARRRIREL